MPRAALWFAACVVVALGLGCSHESSETNDTPKSCDPGYDLQNGACVPHVDACGENEIAKLGGGCEPVGVPADQCGIGFKSDGKAGCEAILPSAPCAPGTMAVPGDTVCIPVGVTKCAAGFVADGTGGCNAVLPKESCSSGKMAIPGESTCRDVSPCGAAPWGDAPVDSSTLYVDVAYSGGGSDGTAGKPFTKIQAAIDAASATATTTIAVAAGSYPETLDVRKPVRIWGRCPSMTEIAGVSGVKVPTVEALASTEVHRVAITGWVGAEVKDSTLVLEEVRIHDLIGVGVHALSDKGPTKLVFRKSLMENVHVAGLYVLGTTTEVEDSVLRDILSRASDAAFGRGIESYDLSAALRGMLTVKGSVIERSHDVGLFLGGTIGQVERTVIRDIEVQTSDKRFGRGISAEADSDTKLGSELTLRDSVVERTKSEGIYLDATKATIESTTVRDVTAPPSDATVGRGIEVRVGEKLKNPSDLVLRNTLVERTVDFGVMVRGSSARIETSILRAARPGKDATSLGRVLQVDSDIKEKMAGTLTLTRTSIEGGAEAGIVMLGIEARVESCVVRDTSTEGTKLQKAQGVLFADYPSFPAKLTLLGSRIEQNEGVGLVIGGATATVGSTLVRDVLPQKNNGGFGHGIQVEVVPERMSRASVTLERSLVERAVDVGVVVIGSDAILKNMVVRDITPHAVIGMHGDGIAVQADGPSKSKATLDISHSLVERTASTGISFLGVPGSLDHVLVRDTRPDGKGKFGDGVGVITLAGAPEWLGRGSGKVKLTLVRKSARAGFSAFGADLDLASSAALCNGFDLDVETLGAQAAKVSDQGANFCGCALSKQVCVGVTSDLEPIPVPF